MFGGSTLLSTSSMTCSKPYSRVWRECAFEHLIIVSSFHRFILEMPLTHVCVSARSRNVASLHRSSASVVCFFLM